MFPLEKLNRLLRCPGCGPDQAMAWAETAGRTDELRCARCGFPLRIEDGVVRVDGGRRSAAVAYYGHTGGPHFIESSFADNITIHCTTRAYTRMLERWFLPQADTEAKERTSRRALLDFGCGDGRFSLWALRRGFHEVVALDASFPALQRLAAAARTEGLTGLLPVCASFEDRCLAPGAFDVGLLIEALYYRSEPGAFDEGLREFFEYLKPGGRAMVAEFCRHGRLLADVAAMNIENMRTTAHEQTRLEKFGSASVAVRHLTPDELQAAFVRAGFRVCDRAGVSPIPMLFHFAYNFTSYPLRPALDEELRALLESLDDQASSPSPLARNLAALLERPAGP